MAAVRGWCPDLFTPMQSGDGWLLRLKPRLARLGAGQAGAIAGQAARHGNGTIELTGRGNLQIRGLTPHSAAAFADFAIEAGLACADPAVERRRNILLSPLADEAACDVARALEGGLAADPSLDGLPGKFGFAVDAGSALGLGECPADIVLRPRHGRWPERAVETALAAARAWLASGAGSRPARGRGPDAGVGKGAIGPLPSLRAFGVGLRFGQIDAPTLQRLSELARRCGDGVLHVTPWRAVILSGIADPAALEAALPAGLITDPDDPARLVSACIGRPGCASGSVDARADAGALIEAGVYATSLHVSGCAKGCAHPGPAALTLVGKDGRYGLVQAGRAGDTADIAGLTLSELARRLGGGAAGS
jgi:precorrin-3B synthase